MDARGLLEGLLGAGGQVRQAGNQDGDVLGNILGQLTGGAGGTGAAGRTGGRAASAGGLGDILGQLTGGGAGRGAGGGAGGGLGDILGQLTGGGARGGAAGGGLGGAIGGVLSSLGGATRSGQDYAARNLGVGDAPEERGAMMKGAGAGALAAGVLGMLLGSGAGKRLGGSALKIGAMAALGGVAWKAYKGWQEQAGGRDADLPRSAAVPGADRPVHELDGDAAQDRSRALLQAMIAAAKADGHIDAHERATLEGFLDKLGRNDEAVAFIRAELAKPLDPKSIAALADSPQGAVELYAMSCTVCDADAPAERRYLDDLAAAMRMDPRLARRVEGEVLG